MPDAPSAPFGRDCAAADGDLAARSLRPAADARGTLPIFALIAPFRGDRAASDGYACNFNGHIFVSHSITNACALFTTGCGHCTTVNDDVASATIYSAADTGVIISW